MSESVMSYYERRYLSRAIRRSTGGWVRGQIESATSSPQRRLTPTVTGVVPSVTTGELTTGKTVTIKLDTNEAVDVTGSPVLLLNDGGTGSYDSAHSTAKVLAFDYTVASGQVTPDLGVIGIETASPSAIADAAGNEANLAGAGVSLGLGVNTAPGTVSGPSGGSLTISGSTELELFGASTAAVTLAAGSTGTLRLDAPAQFAGTVAGLALGNYVDLADLPFEGNTSPTCTSTGTNTGTMAVTEGSTTINIALLGNYSASSFVASSDGHGGTLVTDPPAAQQSLLSQFHA